MEKGSPSSRSPSSSARSCGEAEALKARQIAAFREEQAKSKALGAKVIACASSADKLEFCRSLGADVLIDTSTQVLRDALKAAGTPPDVVYDPVGGPYTVVYVASPGLPAVTVSIAGFAITVTVDGATHTHTASTAGAHTHSTTVATVPPYVALYYIMKIA